MTKFLSYLALSFAVIGSAWGATGPEKAGGVAPELSMAQVEAALPKIANPERKAAMTAFYTECKNKRLFSCQLAWFDLNGAGLDMVYHTKTGLETWEFIGDKQTTSLYRAISIALTSPGYRDGWDLVLRPKYAAKGMVTEVPAREGLMDDMWHFAALDIVQQYYQNAGIQYLTDKGFNDARAEWIRYLALVFSVRRDPINTANALGALKSYAKINNANIVVYNNTINATQKFLSTPGGSK